MRTSMKTAISLMVLGIVGAGLAVSCASDDGQTAELQAQVQQLEEQLTAAQAQLETRMSALEAESTVVAPPRGGAVAEGSMPPDISGVQLQLSAETGEKR